MESVDFDSGPQEDIHIALSSTDIYIMKLQPDGSYAWTRSFPGANNDFSRDIDVDPNGNIFFAGNSSGPIDLNPGCGVDQPSGGEMFIVKLGCVEPNADANDDGYVDLLDFAKFQTCFSGEAPTICNEGCEIFDFDLTGYP